MNAGSEVGVGVQASARPGVKSQIETACGEPSTTTPLSNSAGQSLNSNTVDNRRQVCRVSPHVVAQPVGQTVPGSNSGGINGAEGERDLQKGLPGGMNEIAPGSVDLGLCRSPFNIGYATTTSTTTRETEHPSRTGRGSGSRASSVS